MPYEISFTKSVAVVDENIYINQCCRGGDVVRDRLLPIVEREFENVLTGQEDWGWFIWFHMGPVRLAIDIFTDNADRGAFRIRLTSSHRRLLIFTAVVDTPELDGIKNMVMSDLIEWNAYPNSERVQQ